MFKRRFLNLLIILAVVLAIPSAAFAQSPDPITVIPVDPDDSYTVEVDKGAPAEGEALLAPQMFSRSMAAGPEMVSLIVKLDEDPLATYQGGIDKLAPTDPQVTGAPYLDVDSPESQAYLNYLSEKQAAFEADTISVIPDAQITQRFDVVLGGVAMLVPVDQVDLVATLPGVKAVYPDELLQLNTDTSPEFLGAPQVWNQLGGQENAGESVVIGILDTGIWPEHPSFSDPDPSGKPYAPLATWNGTACEFGSATPGDVPFACNNKLVGANRMMATYDAFAGITPEEFASARDDDGHGSHTASTAGGNAGVQASIFGVDRGVISGIAPRARIAAYKVCGEQGCYSSDSAAAIQQAVIDGVNVINFSISGGNSPYSDAVELAFLDAYSAGVFAAASAGNTGPGADTTNHRGPWVTTVAASTHNRAFANSVEITADGGASTQFTGVSLTAGVGPAPVIVAGDAPYNDPFCINSTADGAFNGAVVVCQRGGGPGRAEKGWNILQRGAVGMILYNQAANVTDLETDNHFLPAAHIQYAQGLSLLSFIASNTNVMATLTQGEKVPAQGDIMASFSARGGPGQDLGVSKPDVTAPGVQILAGASPQHVGVASGPQGEMFQAIAGTSMSSPHVAGAAALLKDLKPSWTPGQIKSALMTTANVNVLKEDGVTPANTFDFGSGRIDLSAAARAKLTFDETSANYVALKDQLWNANYPSLYLPVMTGSITVSRTVHNEDSIKRGWTTSVYSTPDVKVTVPGSFIIAANGDLTFNITVDASTVPIGETRFAMVKFTSKKDEIHFPITLVRKQASVSLTNVCAPTSIQLGTATNCTITATNNTFTEANVTITDLVHKPLQIIRSSITGAAKYGPGLQFTGVLPGIQPPDVQIGAGPSPAGYLPLSLFGIAPVGGVGDETITNFNVPAFLYGSQTYTRIGFVSNGYAVVGGGTGADVNFINQSLPNPTRPNNVLAPFWTDLNPAAGGAMRIGILTDGVNRWLILDWENIREYSTGRASSFQIWIQLGATEGISYAYGAVGGNGDLGFLTVGAENAFGNRGQNYYVDGTGTLPVNGTELVVTTSPPQAGGTHVITFSANGVFNGPWTNCAQMTADVFQGTNISCASGDVHP